MPMVWATEVEFIGYVRVKYVITIPGRPAGLGEPRLSGEALSTLPGRSQFIPFEHESVSAYGTVFRSLASHWPGTRPRRATFFFVVRQRRRQENVPRCRAPFGGSLFPGPSGGVCANSPCGLRHAQPFFRLPSPPVGGPEGTGNAGDQRPARQLSRGVEFIRPRTRIKGMPISWRTEVE